MKDNILTDDDFRITVLLKERQRKIVEAEAEKQDRKFSPMLRIIIDEWDKMKNQDCKDSH